MKKILITGLPISGKSTLRIKLLNLLRTAKLPVQHIDADNFKEIRHPDDKDCLTNIPSMLDLDEETIWIVEDVRAVVPGKSFLPISTYDSILYIYPDIMSHILLLLTRAWYWFLNGKLDYDRHYGWKGTNKRKDYRNIIPIIKTIWRIIKNRQNWLKADKVKLRGTYYSIIKIKWSIRGPKAHLY